MITPHTSARYAVVFAEALEPGADGYRVVAVHAFDGSEQHAGFALVSQVRPHAEADVLAFDGPRWVGWSNMIRLAANGKAAFLLKSVMETEDRRAEREVVAP